MADVSHLDPFLAASRGSRQRRPVREPDITELRAFVAAATLGSIAEAARSLNISGPALSKRLRTLEAVAGVELFNRSPRGVTLTTAGSNLFGPARRLLSSADSMRALMHGPAPVTPVRLAVSPTVAELRLPRALAELAELEPGLAVELVTANSSVVRELVRDGRADLGIAAVDDEIPQDELRTKVVWRDEVVVAVPPGHAWAGEEEIRVEELVATPLVQLDPRSSATRTVAAGLAPLGLGLAAPVAEVGSNRIVVDVATRLGVPALLSLLAAQDSDLLVRRVQGFRFDREYALVWSGSVEGRPAGLEVVLQHLLDIPFARSRRAQRAARRLGALPSEP